LSVVRVVNLHPATSQRLNVFRGPDMPAQLFAQKSSQLQVCCQSNGPAPLEITMFFTVLRPEVLPDCAFC